MSLQLTALPEDRRGQPQTEPVKDDDDGGKDEAKEEEDDDDDGGKDEVKEGDDDDGGKDEVKDDDDGEKNEDDDDDDGDDDDQSLAVFLEAQVETAGDGASSSQDQDQEQEQEQVEVNWTGRQAKRVRADGQFSRVQYTEKLQPVIEDGNFSKIPPELFLSILKFLSSEDLVSCARVCQFLRFAASDESLWRRLYCMRWGLLSGDDRCKKPQGCAWKQLYFEHDKADMTEFVRNTPEEFQEYYIQMQAAKRSQVPHSSQMKDDFIIVDKTVAEQITAWKREQGLPDVFIGQHSCSGRICSYHQIGDVFMCEKTGRVHVCDDTCRETMLDPSNDLLVCTISGRCFDRWLSPAEEEEEAAGTLGKQSVDGNLAGEEAEEPFLGSGRFARAYSLGYNCDDERELDAALVR